MFGSYKNIFIFTEPNLKFTYIMLETQTKSAMSVSRILCSVFGHRFIVTRKVTAHIKEYECTCCGKQATIDVKGNLASLTPQLKEINETLAMLHQKKLSQVQHHTAA